MSPRLSPLSGWSALLTVTLMLTTGPAWTQDQVKPSQSAERREAVSLADAALRALQNNLDISISRQTKESRIFDITVEQAKFDPTLSMNGQYNRQVSPLNRPVFGGTMRGYDPARALAVPGVLMAHNPFGLFVGAACGAVTFLAVSCLTDVKAQAVAESRWDWLISLVANSVALALAGGMLAWRGDSLLATLAFWLGAVVVIYVLEGRSIFRIALGKLMSLLAALAVSFGVGALVAVLFR